MLKSWVLKGFNHDSFAINYSYMKKTILNILILFAIMITSCHSFKENSGVDKLHFKWSVAGQLPYASDDTPSPGIAGAVIGVIHDKLIVGGGSNFPDSAPWKDGKKKYHDEVYVFKKEKDSLVAMDQILHLPYKVAYSANCSTSDGIVAVGGENENGAISKVLLLSWNDSTNKLETSYLPDLPQALTDGSAAVSNNKVYFAGGQNKNSVSNKFYVLDLKDTSAGWYALPILPKPVTHAVLFAQSNGTDMCIYLVGGRKRNLDSLSDLYNEVYQFDLKTGQWSSKASLPYVLSAQTGVSWGDSSLLVFSGDRGKTFHATEKLLMEIAHERDTVKRRNLIAEKNDLQKTHPGYKGTVLLYNTYSDTWIKTDSIPLPGQVTTTAVKWDNEILIPCGEIRAGVRTPDIVVGKVGR